jgi:hypothetical protein
MMLKLGYCDYEATTYQSASFSLSPNPRQISSDPIQQTGIQFHPEDLTFLPLALPDHPDGPSASRHLARLTEPSSQPTHVSSTPPYIAQPLNPKS